MINILNFDGISPKREPLLLNDNSATVAINCRLDAGNIENWNGMSRTDKHISNSAIQSFYFYFADLIAWTNYVTVAENPVAIDEFSRIFYTGDGNPKYTYLGRPRLVISDPEYNKQYKEANGFYLGVPAPNTAPICQAEAEEAEESEESVYETEITREIRAYIYTYVTPLGEESPPSTASNEVTVFENGTVEVTFVTENIQRYNLSVGSFRRLYRTATTNAGSEYQHVADIPIANLEYIDNSLNSTLGEIIPSVDWDKPPQEEDIGALQGIMSMPNGFLVGFVKNTLCFSEIGVGHAWPQAYRISFDVEIVAVRKSGNSIVVLTKNYPYLVTGSEPAAMNALRMEAAQACVSEKSVVDFGDIVIYASPDGLVTAGETGVKLLTEAIFTRDQWQEYNPSESIGFYYERMYLFFSKGLDDNQYGYSNKSFIIDKAGVMSDMSLSAGTQNIDYTYSKNITVKAGINNLEEDNLYIMYESDTYHTYIDTFNTTGSFLNFKWKSKPFRFTKTTILTAARVDFTITHGRGIEFKMYVDDVLRHSKMLLSEDKNKIFRMPRYTGRTFHFQVEGTGIVRSIEAAINPSAL